MNCEACASGGRFVATCRAAHARDRVVGSGIMAQRLAGGNVAIALLANGRDGCVRFKSPLVPFAVAAYIIAQLLA